MFNNYSSRIFKKDYEDFSVNLNSFFLDYGIANKKSLEDMLLDEFITLFSIMLWTELESAEKYIERYKIIERRNEYLKNIIFVEIMDHLIVVSSKEWQYLKELTQLMENTKLIMKEKNPIAFLPSEEQLRSIEAVGMLLDIIKFLKPTNISINIINNYYSPNNKLSFPSFNNGPNFIAKKEDIFLFYNEITKNNITFWIRFWQVIDFVKVCWRYEDFLTARGNFYEDLIKDLKRIEKEYYQSKLYLIKDMYYELREKVNS